MDLRYSLWALTLNKPDIDFSMALSIKLGEAWGDNSFIGEKVLSVQE